MCSLEDAFRLAVIMLKGNGKRAKVWACVSVDLCIHRVVCLCLCVYMLQSSPYGQTHRMMLVLLAFASENYAFFFFFQRIITFLGPKLTPGLRVQLRLEDICLSYSTKHTACVFVPVCSGVFLFTWISYLPPKVFGRCFVFPFSIMLLQLRSTTPLLCSPVHSPVCLHECLCVRVCVCAQERERGKDN